MNKALKMCLNWSVFAGLAVAGIGIGLFAPGLFSRALPLLLLACPISMVMMMAAMRQPVSRVPIPEDIDSLQAQLVGLTDQQEQVSERLARLVSPQPNPNGVEARR